MRRLYFAMLSIAVLAGCGDSSQPLAPPPEARLAAATTETTSEVVPYFTVQFVPCANGGAGEDVQIEGTVHQVEHVTQTGNGQFRVTFHQHPQGLTGIGLVTGDIYRAAGSATNHMTIEPGLVLTNTSQFLLIGPGPDNNFTLHQTFHLTITPDGDLTSLVSSSSVECR